MLWCLLPCLAQKAIDTHDEYQPIDKSQPIKFQGDRIYYKNKEIILNEKNFFLDGQLSLEEASKYPYVFNSFTEAASKLTFGTEDEPMNIYIAPYVYWIDDPDDPSLRIGKDGKEPFGLVINCPYLHLIGLNDNPENIVLASNRGQTQGAQGNFTMLDFHGDGLKVENLTMGNFCNVDLDFPLKKELSREKRTNTITQAHVAYCHGDKAMAENVRFISRLNMNPLSGARRILFYRCHMESTDDALASTGVYLNCDLDFYGQRPFWSTSSGGAVFLNCDFRICHGSDKQYFCKKEGPLAIIDSRFHCLKPVYVGWCSLPSNHLRCYQYNVEFNNEPYIIGKENLENTILLKEDGHLGAYRLTDNDSIVYNIYNLLSGDDDWDPINQKEKILYLSNRDNRDYTSMATSLEVKPEEGFIQTGKEAITLVATPKKPGGFELPPIDVKWKVDSCFNKDVKLSIEQEDKCQVEAINHEDSTKSITIVAQAIDGLEGASDLMVAPDYVVAPSFIKEPKILIDNGLSKLEYSLDLGSRKDESIITWYRLYDKNDTIPIAVSRNNIPYSTYSLTKEDVGHYLIAKIQPKHLRCLLGEEKIVKSSSKIKAKHLSSSNILKTNFINFPCQNQPKIIPGCWTFRGYKPFDTMEYGWQIDLDKQFWTYGKGSNGASGFGLIELQQGAQMLYTPLDGDYGNMSLSLELAPAKTAGQGFNSATMQYMDFYIKFDTETLTGYALRVIRTTKYSKAVDFLLVKYDEGKVEPISDAITSDCFRTPCTITLKEDNGRLYAHAETKAEASSSKEPDIFSSVDLEAKVEANSFGGTGILYTGSCGEGIVSLRNLRVEWE